MTKDIENEIQSWIAVRSFAVEDANPQAPIIDANELAEFVTEVFKKLEGCVVVPVEPTPKMIDSTWNDQDEIETMSHNSRNEFIYKKMIQVAMVEAARAEMSRSDLWCVAIRPECDSHFEQCPAASKELAEKAVARYKSMNEKEGNEFVLEIFDYCFEVQVWEGSEEDHAKEMFYTESWFSEAMYWCDSLEMAERVFKFGEIVDCHKKGFPILKTSDFEKAKRFYEEAKADAEG